MTERRTVAAALALTLITLSSSSLRADVRSDEKAKIEFGGMLGRMFNLFGGKSAKDGVTTTVAVKGDRKASTNGDTGQIIDLAEEKVYDLDMKKKTYKVTTFAELRRQMEQAQKKAQEEARKEEGKTEKAEPSEPGAPPEQQVEVDFDVKNTGQKKTINGFDTEQSIVTVTVREKGKTLEQGGGMVMTTDMWLTPSIQAMKEVYDFDMKYAAKLYGPVYGSISADQMAAMVAMYPMARQALGKMADEGSKLEGTAILTTTTMDAVKSEEQLAMEAKQADNQKSQDRGTVGGLIGGFARRAAAKKMGGGDAAKARSTFMTANTEVLKVVTSVSAEDVAVPAGFKETK